MLCVLKRTVSIPPSDLSVGKECNKCFNLRHTCRAKACLLAKVESVAYKTRIVLDVLKVIDTQNYKIIQLAKDFLLHFLVGNPSIFCQHLISS